MDIYSSNNTLTSGILPINNNCITTYPYYQPSYTYTYVYPTTDFAIQVQKVENGWIVHKAGKQYIACKAEEILQYLQEDTKKSQKVK